MFRKISRRGSLLCCLLALAGVSAPADNAWSVNGGAGYFGDNLVRPGAVMHVELAREGTDGLSAPAAVTLSYHRNPDYHAVSARIHAGFRQHFDSGLFLEQSLGIGVAAKVFTVDSIWYIEPWGGGMRFRDGLNVGLSPAASVGAGYRTEAASGRAHLFWVRPTVYWDLGLRGLHVPFGAVQVGYSTNLWR
jgi:hypothetical protein